MRTARRITFLLLAAIPGMAGATQWSPRRDTLELVRRAERIVVARCLSSQARAVEELGGTIFTFSEFDIIELVKGSLPSRFTTRVVGGTVGSVTVSGDDVPQFEPGDEFVLFLGPDNQDGYPPVDTIYHTERDPDSGQWLLRESWPPTIGNDTEGLTLFRAGTRQEINPFSTADYDHPVTVEDFVWSLRQALQSGE